MKSEPKAFASLSSGLLARKGAARPAMRPQGFGGQIGSGLEDLGWNDMGFEPPKPSPSPVRDLNHDAFGDAIPAPPLRNPAAGLTPVSPVHVAHAEISERLADTPDDDSVPTAIEPEAEASPTVAVLPVQPPAQQRASKPRAERGSGGKAAFTLRLDPERHLKLRLACAVEARSAQQLVTRALDALLSAMPELETMTQRAPHRAGKKG